MGVPTDRRARTPDHLERLLGQVQHGLCEYPSTCAQCCGERVSRRGRQPIPRQRCNYPSQRCNYATQRYNATRMRRSATIMQRSDAVMQRSRCRATRMQRSATSNATQHRMSPNATLWPLNDVKRAGDAHGLKRAKSQGRCGWGEPSPGADVGGVSPSRRRCGRTDRHFGTFLQRHALRLTVLAHLPALRRDLHAPPPPPPPSGRAIYWALCQASAKGGRAWSICARRSMRYAKTFKANSEPGWICRSTRRRHDAARRRCTALQGVAARSRKAFLPARRRLRGVALAPCARGAPRLIAG